MNHRRFMLFRWWRRTQLDIRLRASFLSLGLDRRRGPHPDKPIRRGWRLIAYWSPDATPMHPRARGLKVGD